MRDLLGMSAIALGVALQFVPLFRERLAPFVTRYPVLRILHSRIVQLAAGFGLLMVGIEML